MPAPNRLVCRFADKDISAFILPEQPFDSGLAITCKACSPQKTTVKRIAHFTLYWHKIDVHYQIFECRTCHKQWAVPSRVLLEPQAET